MVVHHIDQAVIRVASAQHGAFHTNQLDHPHSSLFKSRVDSGRWTRQTHFVYTVAGSPNTWRQRVWIRLLLAGRGATVGGLTAARIHQLRRFPEERLCILQPESTVSRKKPRTSKRTTFLPPHHCTVRDGFPITTVARTIFDLAALTSRQRARRGWPYLPASTVERILDDAIVANRTTIDDVARVFADLAGRGRGGTKLMRSLLQERHGDFVPTESVLEDRFLELVTEYDLPVPRRQVVVGDDAGPIGRVDFVYEAERLIVELDGHRFHAQRQVRHADLQRDLSLSAAGWRTIRLDWWQLVEDRATVAKHLRTLLSAVPPK